MTLDTCRKASLALAAWILLYFATAGLIPDIVWQREKKLARRYPVDSVGPLPFPHPVFSIAPTVIVAGLVYLYRLGTRTRTTTSPRRRRTPRLPCDPVPIRTKSRPDDVC